MDAHQSLGCRIRETACVESKCEQKHVVKEDGQTFTEHLSSSESVFWVDKYHHKKLRYLLLALSGLLMALLPISGYNQLPSPVDYLTQNDSLLAEMQSFSIRSYMLGSPLALSTLLEMRCGPVCYSSQRVFNLSDLEPGDHIRHVGSIYAHHSLVDTVLNQSALLVVHFNDDRPNARKVSGYFPYFDKAIVLEQVLLLDPRVDIVELVVYDDYHRVEPKRERLKVARSRLGNTDYGLLTNNCEAFIHELCVGLRYSRQAELISDLMNMLTFIPYLALVRLCHKRFGQAKNEDRTTGDLIFEMDEGPTLDRAKQATSGSGHVSTSLKDHPFDVYGFLVSNVCMAVLLISLYLYYRTCLFILHKVCVFWYHFFFPECY